MSDWRAGPSTYICHSQLKRVHSCQTSQIRSVHHAVNLEDDEQGDESGATAIFKRSFHTWLKNQGLHFNPFDSKFLDAGADPWLSAYLVGHEAFAAICEDRPSFVFAPAGGGKTAFRVRLARACRVGQDGGRIFPIVYKILSPAMFEEGPPSLDRHLHFLCQAIASELLLELAYQPARYLELDPETKKVLRSRLKINLPGSLDHFLSQLDAAGNLSPLVEAFDPSAARLINPPDPSEIRQLVMSLRESPDIPPDINTLPKTDTARVRFHKLIELIRGPLGYEAIYPLIDGVDAHIEVVNDPEKAIALFRALLEQTQSWANERIYIKYFLPQELKRMISTAFPPLTSTVKSVTIIWTEEALVRVLRERLRVASDGVFNSLDAISSPDLRGAELELVQIARQLPREVLALAGRLLVEHVRRVGSTGKLEAADLEAARGWYLAEQSSFSW